MGSHKRAVDAAVAALNGRLTEVDEPLVELARALAKQLDEVGERGPGTRLAATYLTVLRTLASRDRGERRAPVSEAGRALERLRAATSR